MFTKGKVVLRPRSSEDVSRQKKFFRDVALAGMDCHYPHQYAGIDVEDFLTKSDADSASFAIQVDGDYIGYCGLMNLRSRQTSYELGINIGSATHWGLGYGQDAVSLLLNYGFHFLPGRRIELTTHERNERAIACYRACGFVEEGRLRKGIWVEGEYIDLVLMAILRDEWQLLRNDS